MDLLYFGHFVVLKLMGQKKGCKTMLLYVLQFSFKNDKITQFRQYLWKETICICYYIYCKQLNMFVLGYHIALGMLAWIFIPLSLCD